jgi:hypothetical protein
MRLASFMDALSVAWDATNIATLAHAMSSGGGIHSINATEDSCASCRLVYYGGRRRTSGQTSAVERVVGATWQRCRVVN